MVATFFGHHVDPRQQEERQRDQAKADGNFLAAELEIQRHFPLACVWHLVAQHQDRERVERKAPRHAERVRFAEHVDVAAADDDVVSCRIAMMLMIRLVVPNLRCGLRNQSVRTPSSATRFRTPLAPIWLCSPRPRE